MEELESLEDRARAVAASIGKAVSGVLILKHDADAFRQETYIRDLNLEFTNIIKLAESVKSAQAAAGWQEGGFFRLSSIGANNRYYKQGKPRNSDY